MKTNNESLDRLLKSAARAPQPAPGAMPDFLPTRVLAGWRMASPDQDFLPVARLLRIGLGFACAIMLTMTVLHYQQETQKDFYGLDVLNPAINLTMLQ